uniref:Uncharacterized protein n=1 Tax=Ammopiptanthus mongolicus TaxID=126911 RepID=A0A4V1F4X0_AMMMO|nr:hypothetical protein [Ammopiptanthus mongolicus]
MTKFFQLVRKKFTLKDLYLKTPGLRDYLHQSSRGNGDFFLSALAAKVSVKYSSAFKRGSLHDIKDVPGFRSSPIGLRGHHLLFQFSRPSNHPNLYPPLCPSEKPRQFL